MASAFDEVYVNFYASSSKSCRAKHNSTASLIQAYIDNLQNRLGLPSINYNDIAETGGSPTSNDDDVTKWWFVFWEGQPAFWCGLKKSNGEDYATATLERYMPSIKNQLKKKFILSRYLTVIEETYASANARLKSMVKIRKKTIGTPPKNKVYSNEDITFILQRCLWFNSEKYIDFLVFQTLLLRLCSRATETSLLRASNLSIRELCEGPYTKILQCYLVRDKMGVDNNHPLIPNKFDVFADPVVAIGLALFIGDGKTLMPSIALLKAESAVSAHYTTILNAIWKRYPPAENVTVRQGTSHFGKHTAQFLLDGSKLHIAAQLFGGWNVGDGARNEYFSNPFPYLLDGAKSLAGWSKAGGDYQRVSIPSYDVISKDLGDKICSVFFGHIPEDALSTQAKQLILVPLLSKWCQLLQHIRAEPNGLFKDPRNHFVFGTLVKRLQQYNVELSEFNKFVSSCEELFDQTNEVTNVAFPQPQVLPVVSVNPIPQTSQPNKDYTLSLFQHEGVRPLKDLLDEVSRNKDPKVVLVNFFACKFMESYMSTPEVPKRMRCKYYKIKKAVSVMTRFLDTFPVSKPPSLEEAGIVLNRIKIALLSEASRVKHQGKKPFNAATPLHLSIIRTNENLLTDKSKPWYRPLPSNTPYVFIEHCFHHKIYDI
jgi:hypothetical protein